ncbi:hypothetical protein FBY04_12037 [Pseudomonas sp. SJZ080]|uniref:hypothetical protein n=1 Tax=Pseudomonas sp. SJZ080 TaxID=2572888 RepID=UPI00119A8647|nr:hypothetical protein [Pseudomonas sp. SJZ080]TWC50144.1 hypothetical protein FBY04_12037 [Pseudomonas sp. SJZ080]
MSRQHQIAVDMIDSRFTQLNAGSTSAQLHAETSMAYEMAHSLGAIDNREYGHYKARHNRIIEIQHQELMQKLESYR